MKHLPVLTVLFVLAASGNLFSQDSMDITGPPTNSWDGGSKVTVGVPISWSIHMRIESAQITGSTNGFRIYLSDDPSGLTVLDPGPGFVPMSTGVLTDPYELGYYGGWFFTLADTNGLGADTIGFGGFALFAGVPVGTDVDLFEISTEVDQSLSGFGLYLCLDSCWYPPSGQWLWSTSAGLIQPNWGGPYCYEISECCVGNRGNLDMETGPAGPVDVTDLNYLVNYLFNGFTGFPCSTLGNVDGLSCAGGPVDISDLTYLVAYLFTGGPAPPDCD